MSKKLYVGNISFQTTNEELAQVFGQFGTVTSAQVITDRETGRSRGFAFVEMADGGDGGCQLGATEATTGRASDTSTEGGRAGH